MAGWVCVECTTTYSVGAPRCPHCGASDHVEQGEHMPKITRHGGPSIAGITAAWGDEPGEADQERGEESSPGNSSSPSDEKLPPIAETSRSAPRKRARTTGNRSTPARTETSSAPSTDGGQETGTSAADSAAD